jgi:signal peptidase I
MARNPEKPENFRLEVSPESIISDGKTEVTVKCAFKDKKGKASKEEFPVTFLCARQKIRIEKNASHGGVSFKFKPTRATGKTPFHIVTPSGEQSGTMMIRPTPYQYVKDFVVSILLAVIIAFGIIRPFILQTYFIPSESMEPTFYKNDRLVGLMFPFFFRTPHRGEVVVFRRPGVTISHKVPILNVKWNTKVNFIKRVIAVGGDTIEIHDLTVYVNNKPLKEPYVAQPPFYRMPPVKVPKGSVFLMGDNRNNSLDSHVWGALPLKYVQSKAWAQFWPIDRLKVVH